MKQVLVIGTVETKRAALDYLCGALRKQGLAVELLDVSLDAGGTVLSSPEKLALMGERAKQAAAELAARHAEFAVAIGLGGGTGGEIVTGALKGLPATYPKFLITTLPADPRAALADSAITLVPTLCDIEGMNAMLAQVFSNTAAMAAGIVGTETVKPSGRKVVAMTTLGVTGAASARIADALTTAGFEPTVFHANGYGGAAFTRFVQEGRADGVIDLNVHELGRIRLAGAHVPMADRFSAGGALPRIVLPGALNFIGLGSIETVSDAYLARPHYRHSSHFTHVKLTNDEMANQTSALSQALNRSAAPCHVILPMGGFSSEDRPGGAIEDAGLRETAAEVFEANAKSYDTTRLPYHINAPELSEATAAAFFQMMSETEHYA